MKTRLLGWLVALASVAWAPMASAYSLFLTADPSAVAPGGQIRIGVGVDDAASLSSFQFALQFDATVVQPGTPSFSTTGTLIDPAGSDLADASFPFTVDVTPSIGLIDVFAESLEGLKSSTGSGVLLYLLFDVPSTATAPDTADFIVGDSLLGFNLADPNSSAVPDVSDARVTVTIRTTGNPVPEPAGIALGVLALALAAGARRRRIVTP